MRKIPSRLRRLSKEQNWKTVKDEIRGLVCIPEEDFKVFVSDCKGHLFANCEFKDGSDAHEVFGMYTEDR